MNDRPTGRPTPGVTPIGSPTGRPPLPATPTTPIPLGGSGSIGIGAPPISAPSLPPVPPIPTGRPPTPPLPPTPPNGIGDWGTSRMFVVIDKKSGRALGQFQFGSILFFPSTLSARTFALNYYKVKASSYTLSSYCEIKPAIVSF